MYRVCVVRTGMIHGLGLFLLAYKEIMANEFVRLDFDVKSVQRTIDELPRITKRVTAGTLNKVGRKANTAAKKFITSNYNIKARSLKLGNLVSLRTADARKPNPAFTIFIRKRARGLFKYGAKQLKTGVSVRVTKARKKISSAFISSWRKGGIQQQQFVFLRDKALGTVTRISKSGRPYKATKRRSLLGPSVAQLYNSRKVRVVINKTIVENYQPVFDADFKKQLDRKRK